MEMTKLKFNLIVFSSFLLALKVCLIDFGNKIPPFGRKLVIPLGSFQHVAMRKEEPLLFPEEVSATMKNYFFNGCNCVREGYDVTELERARQVVVKKPWTQPEWFLSKYPSSYTSTCSDYATQRGVNQKVISYSYYHTERNLTRDSLNYIRYLKNLYTFSRSVATSYPGWVARVYYNTSADDKEAMKILCKIYCELSHVDLCHVKNLPLLGNLSDKQPIGRLWRFAVMGDPTVAQFMIRDSDSAILPREISAVNEWISSGQLFHVMRDHPEHKAVILADHLNGSIRSRELFSDPVSEEKLKDLRKARSGLWGGYNANYSLMASIRNDMFAQPVNYSRNFDQYLLASKLWPIIKKDTLRHETYHCKDFSGSKSFPTRRDDGLYCGYGPQKLREQNKVYETICPKECRKHQHWLWC